MPSSKMSLTELVESHLRDRDAMRKAARHMDVLRERFGKPEKGFNSVAILRRIREAR